LGKKMDVETSSPNVTRVIFTRAVYFDPATDPGKTPSFAGLLFIISVKWNYTESETRILLVPYMSHGTKKQGCVGHS
jgi:hypothetical protein